MKKTKILLFTNDKWTSEIFQEALNDSYVIYVTSNPDRVVEAAIENEIDMFFIDMDLAGVDGYQVCGYLNDIVETRRITKVMIVMAMDLELFQKAKEAGVSDFLLQPLYSGEVRIKIENILYSNENLERLLREKQDIVASHVGFSVEHYIGQPLTAILGAVETLKLIRHKSGEIEREELNDILDIIIDASKELNTTIRKFGKLSSYKVTRAFDNEKIIELDELDTTDEETGDIEIF